MKLKLREVTGMGLKLFSKAWVKAFEAELQANEDYTRAGKGWEGAVALQIPAEASAGLAEDLFILLDLHDGVCRSIKLVSAAEAEKAPYIIAGPYASWKLVLAKKMGPVKGLMTGKLKLKRGSLGTLTRYLKAVQCIVDSAAAVETVFPDEG